MKRDYIEKLIFQYSWTYRSESNNTSRLRDDYNSRFGKTWRWGQEEIAKLIDVSRVTVSSLLNGKTKLDLVMLLKVAYLTGLSFEEIIREEIKLGFLDPKFYNLLGDKK